MRKLCFFVLTLVVGLLVVFPSYAQAPVTQEFSKGQVVQVKKEEIREVNGVKNPYQLLEVKLLDGSESGKTVTIESGATTTLSPSQMVKAGDTVVLLASPDAKGGKIYQVYDNYRVNSLVVLAIGFVLFIILMAWLKGIGSLLGMLISLGIIFAYIVPQILAGADPLTTSILGSIAILLLTTYLAHGVSRQTTVAVIATFVALLLTAWLASLSTAFAHLTGFTEEVSVLQFGTTHVINTQGLLLAGIIIGSLGALNDVTTTQAAAIFELSATNPKLTFSRLFVKGFFIGREHVVSMVNTLVLAYAGSSLALFLIMSLNPGQVPWWVILNSEEISDEIVRTIVGSMGLMIVIPVVTALAALVCDKEVRDYFRETLKAVS